MSNPKSMTQNHRRHPELVPGIRIQYWDKYGAVRTERIHSRQGSIITVINVLKEKRRIKLEQVHGYWEPKVKPSPRNLHVLKVKKRLFSGI